MEIKEKIYYINRMFKDSNQDKRNKQRNKNKKVNRKNI